MKKLIALICVALLVLGTAVTAFAAESPSGDELIKITITTYKSGSAETEERTLVLGETITLTASESEYTFEKWQITGEYEIVSGSLTSKELVIRPLGDIDVIEVFEGVDINSSTGSSSTDTSPQTGDAFPGFAAAIVLVAAGAFIVMKKTAKAL